MSLDMIAAIYDSLSDNDKRLVGMLGVCFLRGFTSRLSDFFDKYFSSNKSNSSQASE